MWLLLSCGAVATVDDEMCRVVVVVVVIDVGVVGEVVCGCWGC